MRLLYYKSDIGNFGDDLNAALWEKLAPGLFMDKPDQGFLGIGTIIGKQFPDVETLHIFSSGAGYDEIDTMPDNRKVWCVRGPISAKLIGADPSTALTDGAILSPLIFPKPETSHGQTIVIPHWETLLGCESEWQKSCDLAGFKLVSPMQPVETVLVEIGGAAHVLTESLHGAILADTYGVSWSAWACSRNFSLLKWMDWARSLDVTLEINLISPPNGKALKTFGMPKFGKFGDCVRSLDEIVDQEFSKRLDPNKSPKVSTISFAAQIKTLAKRTLLSAPLDRIALKMSPRQTSRHLADISSNRQRLLSTPQKRKALMLEMLKRLESLCAAQTTNDSFHEVVSLVEDTPAGQTVTGR